MLNTYVQHQIRNDLIVCTNTGNFPTSRNIQETLDRILRKCGLLGDDYKVVIKTYAFPPVYHLVKIYSILNGL